MPGRAGVVVVTATALFLVTHSIGACATSTENQPVKGLTLSLRVSPVGARETALNPSEHIPRHNRRVRVLGNGNLITATPAVLLVLARAAPAPMNVSGIRGIRKLSPQPIVIDGHAVFPSKPVPDFGAGLPRVKEAGDFSDDRGVVVGQEFPALAATT